MSPRRLLAVRSFAVAVSLGAGLLCLELGARLVLTNFYRCDETFGWTFEPGKTGLNVDRRLEYGLRTRINSAGFHDVEHALEKPPGTLRIALLGDSMLAALQVPIERGLARRLETRLNEGREGGPRFEVVNCATDGFGTAQARLMFEQRCRQYQPDLVLLGFFAFNDVLDNYWGARSLNHPLARKCGRPYFELRDGRLARVDASLPGVGASPIPRLDRWLRRSYLYQILAPPLEHAGGEGPLLRSRHVFLREYRPEQWRAWDVTKELLRALDADVRESGARLGVLAIPSHYEIHPTLAREEFRTIDQMDLERPRRILTDFLRESGLTHLDLTSGIQQAARESQEAALYFPRDAHFTERGNDVAAGIVAAWLATSCGALGLGEACGGARPYSLRPSASGAEALPVARPPASVAPESSSTTGPPPDLCC